MFIHLLKYKLKAFIREKEYIGWIFLFPIVLGTFFYLSFGHIINSDEYDFKPVPVAYVSEGNSNEMLEGVLDDISKESEDQIFQVTKTDKDTAIELLNGEEVDGIIIGSPDISVIVSEKGLNQTIIKSFIESYLKHQKVAEEIMTTNPEKMEMVMDILTQDISYNEEISPSNAKMDSLSQYFFALIAMTCMYGSLIGRKCVEDIQANMSQLGARRETSPTHKLTVICADFWGTVLIGFSSVLLLLFYLIVIIKIDFGTRIPYIILTGFFGSVIGVAMGFFIGSIGKLSRTVKEALASSISLLLSFLSGLMISNMKDIVEHTIPIVNRINPAALITDCLYSLVMYDTFDRFYSNLLNMGIIAGLFILGSYLLLRRRRYASI